MAGLRRVLWRPIARGALEHLATNFAPARLAVVTAMHATARLAPAHSNGKYKSKAIWGGAQVIPYLLGVSSPLQAFLHSSLQIAGDGHRLISSSHAFSSLLFVIFDTFSGGCTHIPGSRVLAAGLFMRACFEVQQCCSDGRKHHETRDPPSPT